MITVEEERTTKTGKRSRNFMSFFSLKKTKAWKGRKETRKELSKSIS